MTCRNQIYSDRDRIEIDHFKNSSEYMYYFLARLAVIGKCPPDIAVHIKAQG